MSAHRARRRFGQNFLHDRGVIARIVDAVAPRPDDRVVEIGPGKGALTGPLLERVARLTVVEIDRDLAAALHARPEYPARLAVIESDALRLELAPLAADGPLRLVGNLPYNISTPLLFHLFAQAGLIADMHFMLQREVVARMTAPPGSRTYGRLSVMVAWHCEAQSLFEVGPGAFNPAPRVRSAVVRLVPRRTPPCELHDPALFSRVVADAFMQRRKTLYNALGRRLSADEIAACGVDAGVRPETLPVEAFARLANAIHSKRLE